MKAWSALLLVTALVLCGCGGGRSPEGSADRLEAPRPSSAASLAIVEPQDDATVRGDAVEVVFRLEGGTLVDLTATEVRPDEGHLHVTLDGALVSMTGGLEQELTGLEPGRHLLKAEYVAADHAPFEPRVLAAVAFTVEDR